MEYRHTQSCEGADKTLKLHSYIYLLFFRVSVLVHLKSKYFPVMSVRTTVLTVDNPLLARKKSHINEQVG